MDNPTDMVKVTVFDAARLTAFDRHKTIETLLATILSKIIGSKLNVAMVIFFRISNTRARYAIFSDLLKLKQQKKEAKIWGCIEKELGSVDQFRNQLVHWAPVVDLGVAGPDSSPGPRDVNLHNPAKMFNGSLKINLTDIEAFKAQLSRMAIRLMMFSAILDGSFPEPSISRLVELFQQPSNDQNQDEILKFLTSKESEPPPQSSHE